MFYCERCGTKFNAGAATDALACPRCRTKDGVFSPLTFEIFDRAALRAVGTDPTRGGVGEGVTEDRSPKAA